MNGTAVGVRVLDETTPKKKRSAGGADGPIFGEPIAWRGFGAIGTGASERRCSEPGKGPTIR